MSGIFQVLPKGSHQHESSGVTDIPLKNETTSYQREEGFPTTKGGILDKKMEFCLNFKIVVSKIFMENVHYEHLWIDFNTLNHNNAYLFIPISHEFLEAVEALEP